MRSNQQYAPIRTKDVNEIMRFVRVSRTLSPVAYKRLHYYVVSLERMLTEALASVRAGNEPGIAGTTHIPSN